MNSEQNKKDRDKDKILHTLQDMFIDVLDLEVIQNVAHNCDFSLHGSIEALMMLAEGAPPKSSPPTAQVTEHIWHPMAEGASCTQLFPMRVPELPLRPLEHKPSQQSAQAKDPPTAAIFNPQSIAESCPSPGSIKISYRGQNGCSSSDDDADVFIEDEQECDVSNPTQEVNTFSMFSTFSPQFITPILPAKPPSVPLVQMQQKPPMKASKPPNIPPSVPSMATAALKLKDIKPQPSVSKARKKAEHVQSTQLKIMQQLSPIERLQKMILDGVSLMVIMRGVPGSGKSHLAQHLVLTTLGRNVDFSCHVFSTDDFFALMNNQFNPVFLQHAHEWNRRRVQQAIAKKVSPIIIDNTNTQVWEMQPYAQMAVQSGYALELLEPNTAWRYHEAELFKRNLHGVPRPQIRAMLDRFEHNLTSKKLLDMLGLKYSSNNKPNVTGKNAGKSTKPKAAKISHVNEEQNASPASAGKNKKVRTRRRRKRNQSSNVQKPNGIPYIGQEQMKLYAEAYAALSKKSEPADVCSSHVSSEDPVGTSLHMSNQKNLLSKDDMSEDNSYSVSSESGTLGLCLSMDGQSLTDGSSSSSSEYEEDEEEEEKKSFSTSLEANKLQTGELNSQLDELFYSDDDKEVLETKEKNTECNPCTDYMLVLSDSTLLPQKHYEKLEEKKECWEYMLVLPDSVHVPQKQHATDELNKTEAAAAVFDEIQPQIEQLATNANTNAQSPADTALIDLTEFSIEKDEAFQNQMSSCQFVPESYIPVCSPSLIDTPLEDVLVDLSLSVSDKDGHVPACELTNENLLSAVVPLSSSSDSPNIQLELTQNNEDTELQELKSSCVADNVSISVHSLSSGELDHWLSSVEEKSPEGSTKQELHHINQGESAVMKENSYIDVDPADSNLLVTAHDSNDEEFHSALSSNGSLAEDKISKLPDILNLNDTLLMKVKPEEALEIKSEENSVAEENNTTLSKPRKEGETLQPINDLFPMIALEKIPKYDFLTLVNNCETKESSEEQMENTNEQKMMGNSNGTSFEDHNLSTENTKSEFTCTEQLCHTYQKNVKDALLNTKIVPEHQKQSTTVDEEKKLSSSKMTHCVEENNCVEVTESDENYKCINAEVCLPKHENELEKELKKIGFKVQQLESDSLCLKEDILDKPSDETEKAKPLHMENELQVILNRSSSFERGESVISSMRQDELSNATNVTQEGNRLHKDSTEEEKLNNWEEIGDGWQDQEIVEQKTYVEDTADLPKPARERKPFRKSDSPYRVLITQTHEPKFEHLSIPPEMDAWGTVPEPVQSWENNEKSPFLESPKEKHASLPQPQRKVFSSEVALKGHLEAESESCQAPSAAVSSPESLEQLSNNSVESDNFPSSVLNKASTLKDNDLKPFVGNSEYFEQIKACSMELSSFSTEKREVIEENLSINSEAQQSKCVNENEYLFPTPDLSSWKSVSCKTEMNIARTDMENGPSLQLNLESEERESNEVEMEEELILTTDIGENSQLTSEKGNIEDNFVVQSSTFVPMTNFDADTVQSSESVSVTNFDAHSHTISSSLLKLQTCYGLPQEDTDYDTNSASLCGPKRGMTTTSTNTLREDFMILEQVERLGSPAGPMKDISILHARSRSIDEGLNIASEGNLLSTLSYSAQGVRTYDKSSMTDEEDRDFAAAMLASAHEREANFNQLLAIFPAINKDDLLEIFDRCNGDLNWAADILLESGDANFSGAASNSPPTHDRESDESAGAAAERDFASEQGAAGGLLWWENVPTETASSLECQISEDSSLRDYGPDFSLSPHQNRNTTGRMSNSLKGSPSEASQQLKKQLEERVVLSEHCYSERTRRIWNFKHGQKDAEERRGLSEATGEAPTMFNLNAVEEPSNEKQELQRYEPDTPQGRVSSDKVSDIEDEYIEEEEEDEELVPFTIDAEFASQLQQLFGNAGTVPYDEDASLDVKLPLSLARQIHSYLVETQQSIMEHQYKEMQKMIREDEELARRLQEEERETKNSVPDLRVVMDMEMALELYRSDQKQWKNGQGKDDLATKLSKQKLCQMFPNLDQDALLQLFTAHGNSFEDTVNEVVVSVDGSRDTEAVRNVLAPEALAAVERNLIEQARQESLKIVENQIRPLPIVVLREPGESKVDPQEQAKADAEHYRIEANRHRQLRSECINKAQDAYRAGMKTVASYYSQMASLHRQRIDEANARAASSLVTADTLSQNSTTLDLHFLHVVEALQVLDMFLDHRIVNLASANRASEYVFLITGRGLRSAGGRSRIRPAVEMRLKQRVLKWSLVNPGMLKVQITRNSVLAYSSVSTTL